MLWLPDIVTGIEAELANKPLETDWFPWLAVEVIVEEILRELARPLEVSPGETVTVPLLPITEYGDVRLPVAETLLSVKPLMNVGGTVALEDAMNDSEIVFGDTVNDAEDIPELPVRGVVLIDKVSVGEDLLIVKLPVTAEVVKEVVKEVCEADPKLTLVKMPSEAKLPVRLDIVPVVVIFVIALEGDGETEDSLFGTGPVALEYGSDTPPLLDIPELGKLVDPISASEPLELGVKEPGTLPVTGPTSAEVTLVPFGNTV
ncbi:hypothetical protein HD806DRAFT_550728 [Xylariaceae sp. AK1471]|nr:hypothetical protein HD806DRAFT_550728 [Xylariaceae sp. AK1471]